jgi:branched-chain amino acid transport system ATP-binding protein
MAEAALRVSGLVVQYGGITAVKGLDLSVQAGETVALIGANGAGKSSTLRAITGLVPAAAGQIWHDGVEITRTPGHVLPGRGLVMVPEGRGILGRMTIEENLRMGAHARPPASRHEIAADLQAQYDRFPRLAERQQQLAGTLSGGEQQMLAMARALMARPRLLLLDEPSMGLSPVMVEKIFELIAEVSKQGMSLLLVEQNARLALQIAGRAVVLESGEKVLEGRGNELLHHPMVRSAYLGE